MAIAFNVPPRSLYLYPLATNCKFAERLRPEQAAKGVARKNKLGETVYERYYDAVGGRIVGLSIIPPSERVNNPQYQVAVADPDDPAVQGYISFGQNTSLGRQLINQLLGLTPDMLSGIVTFTLRASGGGENGEPRGVYLNVYHGKTPRYEYRVPRRFSRDEIPQGVKLADNTWDFSAANAFFAEHAEKLAAEWSVLLPQLHGSLNAGEAGAEDEYEALSADEGGFDDSGYLPAPNGIAPDDTIPF